MTKSTRSLIGLGLGLLAAGGVFAAGADLDRLLALALRLAGLERLLQFRYTCQQPLFVCLRCLMPHFAVFFQLGSPYPEVQQRGYAAALILTILVLAVSLGSRWLSARLNRYTIK